LGQFGPARVAEITDGLERPADDAEERGWKISMAVLARRERGVSFRIEGHHGADVERKAAGCHFVQDEAETPDIAACIELEAARLLRRHVARRADCHSRLRAELPIDLVG